MTQSSMDSIFKPVLVLMSGRVLGYIAAFAIPIILAREFSQNDFGTYKQLFLVFSTLYCIAQLGMAESLFYFLPAAPQRGGHYTFNAMLVLIVAGIISALVLWATQANVARMLNNAALTEYLPYIGVYLLLMLISTVLEIVMTTRKMHLQASVAYALSDLIRAALLIAPVLFFGDLLWLLFGAITFAALRLGATIIYLHRQYGSDFAPNAELARAQLVYAIPFSIYVAIDVLQTNLHHYAVSYYFDAATFAIYAVGCLSIPLVDFLTGSAGNVMMVRMREHLLTGAQQSVLAIWGDTTRKLMMVFAPLVGGLLIVAHELIVLLYTDTYEKSVPIFMIWVVIILFASLLTDCVLRVYSQLGFLMLLSVIKLLLIGVSINWFLSTFGLNGAVLAMLMTIVVTKVIALGRIKSVMQCRWSEFLPWQNLAIVLVIAGVAAIPALMVKSVLSTFPNLAVVMVTGFVYMATYIGLLWRYGQLAAEEKIAIVEYAVKPIDFLRSRRA